MSKPESEVEPEVEVEVEESPVQQEEVPVEPEPKPKPEPKVQHRVLKEETSGRLGNLALALAKAQGMMSNGAKDKQGYGYKYMELGSLIDIARPALTANELAVIQTHELFKGKQPSVVTHTTLLHSSGEWHKSSIELPIKVMPQLSQAQMIGVNATYGRRYSLQALCLIASETDSDGDSK